jgi:hypothetical protein
MPGHDEPFGRARQSNDDAAGKRERRKAGANLLVPQGGFEPSTYRLRSDCSAVELLRRPQASLVAKKPGARNSALSPSCPGLTRASIERKRFD